MNARRDVIDVYVVSLEVRRYILDFVKVLVDGVLGIVILILLG